MQEIDSFILIGGRSSRFGADKVFAKLAGRTLVEHALDTVRDGLPHSRITMVAGAAAEFGIQAIIAGVPFIHDLYEARGPLGGLHAALSYARTKWIFVLACDYPFVPAELIDLLRERMSDEFGVVAPEQRDGRLQPLCAFYQVERVSPIVENILLQTRIAPPPMHDFVSKLEPRVVKFEEYVHVVGLSEAFININTPEDLELARKLEGEL